MREQSRAEQQENGNNTQHQNGTVSAQSDQSYPWQNTYIVPASQQPVERDFNYRTNITIQSPQRQWPEEIWYHGPTHRVLYRIDLVLHEPGYQDPAPQETAPTQNTEENTQQGGTNGCSSA